MSAHTPGPWVFGNWVTGKPGEVPEAGWVDVWAPTAAGKGLPCAACAHGNVEANARLISAAPDLLAALQAIEATAENDDDCLPESATWQAIKAARAAIAKATGEAA